jgi:protein-S-isoprenylcysteine O-methyltransferase Ste14
MKDKVIKERTNKKSFTEIIFKYRSYTPVPFIIALLIFHNANTLSLVIGFLMVVSGEAIRLWGVSWIGSETRTTGNYGGTFLIINGPYAFVRNPLYVGNILIYSGAGVMAFALFPYLQIAGLVFFSIQYLFIIKDEEQFLSGKFGKDFKTYTNNVPKLIPRLTPYRNTNIIQPPFKLKAGLRSEKRTLQAIVFVTVLILILWILKIESIL